MMNAEAVDPVHTLNGVEKEKENVRPRTRNGHLNPHVPDLGEDHLYHIALSNTKHDLKRMFGDLKFVCFGGQASRMENFARFIQTELSLDRLDKEPVQNFASETDRYAVFKAGPVLSVSHGIGIPSLSIIFQEIVKLLYHADCLEGVTFFRIGTCGGLGLPPGTAVVSENVVNGEMESAYTALILGKRVKHPAVVNKELARELCACAEDTDDFKTILGTTLCADDFYEGQGRIDGAFCDHNSEDKMAWLRQLRDRGVTNMEMESLGFITMCHRAKIRGAVVCVTLLDRFHGDGITADKAQYTKWQIHPQRLVARYIRKQLGK